MTTANASDWRCRASQPRLSPLMRSPAPAKERLAALLKQGSSIPELKDFRNQCRDVFRLGGVIGLDEWIEARRDLGLFPTRQVERAADDLQFALGRVIDQAMANSAPSAPVSMSWEEKLARLQRTGNQASAERPACGLSTTPASKAQTETKGAAAKTAIAHHTTGPQAFVTARADGCCLGPAFPKTTPWMKQD